MNVDLEKCLVGDAAGLQALVLRMRTAPQAHVRAGFAAEVMSKIGLAEAMGKRSRLSAFLCRPFGPATLFPLAACLVVMLAVCSVFMRPVPAISMANLLACQRQDGSFSQTTAAPYVQAFAVTVLAKDPSSDRAALNQAVEALVRTQSAEGGWANARLSARNVAALSAASDAGVKTALSAYRRGLRYLRTHGIGEMSVAEVVRDAKEAERNLAGGDNGLACSISLAARL